MYLMIKRKERWWPIVDISVQDKNPPRTEPNSKNMFVIGREHSMALPVFSLFLLLMYM